MRCLQDTAVQRILDDATSRHGRARQVESLARPADRDSAFHALLDDAVGEIRRREPDYFDRFDLTVPPVRVQAQRYRQHPVLARCSETAIEAALSEGIERFRKCGVNTTERKTDDEVDPVAALLCDSIADAFAASLGRLHLSAVTPASEGNIVIGYDERRTPDGVRYFMRCFGERPLVLVNASGMSLSLWSHLLADQSYPWRLIAAESPCTDVFAGGMRAATDLTTDVSAIAATLDDAAIDRTDMVAWCSGARIAIEFAGRFPERIKSLTLISPTLRGTAGATPVGSAFENDLNRIFEAIDRNPHLARTFADVFRSLFEFTDWEKLANQPDKRIEALLGLSARERISALIAPLARPDHLVNYSRRVLCDQRHPLHASLARLTVPLMLVVGDYDNRVNNAFTRAVLKAWSVRFLEVRVKGAGHYLYDLQYQYFRSILSAFLVGASPTPSVRVEVEGTAN
jgi:pimeloyl-ACP methyl ester carboxylesterase